MDKQRWASQCGIFLCRFVAQKALGQRQTQARLEAVALLVADKATPVTPLVNSCCDEHLIWFQDSPSGIGMSLIDNLPTIGIPGGVGFGLMALSFSNVNPGKLRMDARLLWFTLPKKQRIHLRVLNQRTAFPSTAGKGSSRFSET